MHRETFNTRKNIGQEIPAQNHSKFDKLKILMSFLETYTLI